MKKFHYDPDGPEDQEDRYWDYADQCFREDRERRAFEEYEATIAEAFEENKERPDLFVTKVQTALNMSDEQVMKEVFDRYPHAILTKYYFFKRKDSLAS